MSNRYVIEEKIIPVLLPELPTRKSLESNPAYVVTNRRIISWTMTKSCILSKSW